jgi:negative regulator of replication initiation
MARESPSDTEAEAGGFKQIWIDLEMHRSIERLRQSFGESESDILRRALRLARDKGGTIGSDRPTRPIGSARSRGLWSVEFAGRSLAASNLKDAYRVLLCELAAAHPHFLEAFADEKGKSRRYVARTPQALYGRSVHLVRHAAPLVEGWYFDSNLSAARASRLARIAARLCGLHYGSDVRILDNLREV